MSKVAMNDSKDQGLTFPTLRQTLSTPIAIPRRQPRISLFCSPPKLQESPEGLVFDMSPVESTFSDSVYQSLYGLEAPTSRPSFDRAQSSPTFQTREPFLYTFPTPSRLRLGLSNKNRMTSFTDTCSTSSSVDEVTTPISASHFHSREPSIASSSKGASTPQPRKIRGFKPSPDFNRLSYPSPPPENYISREDYRFPYHSAENGRPFSPASLESDDAVRVGRFERY